MSDKHGYDKSRENILKGFYQESKTEIWTNTRTAETYKCNSYFLDIPRIIISSFIGSMALFTESVKDEQIKMYIIYMIGVLGIINSLIGTLAGFFNFAEKSQIHMNISQQWNNLSRKIDIVLSLPRHDRPEAKTFLNECKEEYNRISEISLEIPSCIVNSFTSHFKKQIEDGYKVSWYLNGIRDINIYHTSDDEKSIEITEIIENELINL